VTGARRRAAALPAFVLAAAACAGCALQTTPHGRFAALSTRQAPALGYQQLDGAPRTRDVEAVVLSQHFLWVPTETSPPRLEDAVEEALRRGNGDLLVDVEVDRIFFAVPLIYAQEGWRVRGDVIRIPEREGLGAPGNAGETPPPPD
jgi:hypothetical protein